MVACIRILSDDAKVMFTRLILGFVLRVSIRKTGGCRQKFCIWRCPVAGVGDVGSGRGVPLYRDWRIEGAIGFRLWLCRGVLGSWPFGLG